MWAIITKLHIPRSCCIRAYHTRTMAVSQYNGNFLQVFGFGSGNVSFQKTVVAYVPHLHKFRVTTIGKKHRARENTGNTRDGTLRENTYKRILVKYARKTVERTVTHYTHK